MIAVLPIAREGAAVFIYGMIVGLWIGAAIGSILMAVICAGSQTKKFDRLDGYNKDL